MESKLMLIAALGLGLIADCLRVHAASPTYKTFAGYGNASSSAALIIPADPSTQIRLVSVSWYSDTNTATINYQTGLGAYVTAQTNLATTWQTQQVATTVGLVTNSYLVLDTGSTNVAALLIATNSTTNLTLNTGGWGIAAPSNASIYQMDSPVSWYVGATTNMQAGEALFVANPGRPLRIYLSGALVTNRITATVRYE